MVAHSVDRRIRYEPTTNAVNAPPLYDVLVSGIVSNVSALGSLSYIRHLA